MRQRLEKAQRALVEALQGIYAQGDLEQRFGEAYYDYMRTVQFRWTALDVTTLHPAELTAISESMAFAANLATLSLEIIRQRGLAASYYQGLLSPQGSTQ